MSWRLVVAAFVALVVGRGRRRLRRLRSWRHGDERPLGGTVPLSGEASAFGAIGPGAKAYFDHVNARGGVHGRKIDYLFYDDAYNPAQTVQLTRKLVEQDNVFAIFNSAGTANNLAIRDYLNARRGATALRRRRLGGDRRTRSATPGRWASCRATAARGRLREGPGARRAKARSPSSSRTRSSARTCRAASRARSPARARRSSPRSRTSSPAPTSAADRQAEDLAGGHADALRHAEVRDPGGSAPPTSSAGSRSSTSPRSRSSPGSWRSRAPTRPS